MRSKSLRPLSRRSSIHCGSFFFAEMSRTTSSLRPRLAVAPAVSESGQPNSYRPRPSSSGLRSSMRGHRGQPLVRVVVRMSGGGAGRGRRGCRWCTPRRRGRWWPVAARGGRARRLITSVSASHSWGNSWATCETGQCCWHSCSPTGPLRTEAAYPSAVSARASASAALRSGSRGGDLGRSSLLDRRRPGAGRTRAPRRRHRSRRGSAAPARRGRRTAGRTRRGRPR